MGHDSKGIEHLKSIKENRNFEMIGFPRPIFVAKKTDALKQILSDINDFDTVLVLTCHAIDENNTIHTELVHSTPETLDNSIDNVVKQAIAIQSSSMLG